VPFHRRYYRFCRRAQPESTIEGIEKHLNQLGGYYTSVHVLMLMGFMALCRIKTVEQLRAEAPGEFGKLLGLDRIPEVRCLRRKLSELGKDEAADRWAAHLSQKWMQADPEAAGTLYVDGHVRVYHGSKSALPRRYVSRQRLCLRGISDYWVNDAIGQPFFVVEKPVDPGLLETLRTGIVPRLLREVPNQPSEEELQANPQRSRFTLVFDREGYSPGFFAEMWRTHRIGCITYTQAPSWSVARGMVPVARGHHARRRKRKHGTGRDGQSGWFGQTGFLDARSAQADRKRPSGQPHQHGF